MVHPTFSDGSINIDGPIGLTATFKYNLNNGFSNLVGINFQTPNSEPLGRQSSCGASGETTVYLTPGELEIGSGRNLYNIEMFIFASADEPYRDRCNHLWKITYASNVILLGTNGA